MSEMHEDLCRQVFYEAIRNMRKLNTDNYGFFGRGIKDKCEGYFEERGYHIEEGGGLVMIYNPKGWAKRHSNSERLKKWRERIKV